MKKANAIEHAHVRDVDYNPKKQHLLATAEDELGICIWDLRRPNYPLKELPGHTHWCLVVLLGCHIDQPWFPRTKSILMAMVNMRPLELLEFLVCFWLLQVELLGMPLMCSRSAPISYLTPVALVGVSSPEHQSHSWTARRGHFGHSHHGHGHGQDHAHDRRQEAAEADGVFRLGLAADIALAADKTATGYLSGSTAIIADAAHSIYDIVLSGVAWLSYRAALVPKDEENPYGHGKYETLGALGISGVLSMPFIISGAPAVIFRYY